MSSDHSCHAGCQKPLCMLRREKDLRAELAAMEQELRAEQAEALRQHTRAEDLQSELAAEKSARMVERAALSQMREAGSWAFDHEAINRYNGPEREKQLCEAIDRSDEALSQPAPDVGALVKRLTSCLIEIVQGDERVWKDHPQSKGVYSLYAQECQRALADTESDRKRMNL